MTERFNVYKDKYIYIELNSYTKRRGQKEPEEAKRAPKSFLKESCIESIRLSPDLPFAKGIQKIWG
ncbi:unknown protein [Paenibacillus amylolyticus]|uniref:Uncharacterized protein n=1 Tax=Paenibacillus amylolyticus TaxID=1451 RepID=A0A100VJX5_PAEAM|nr:unknown protein [Paenibacillus amylolyticus]